MIAYSPPTLFCPFPQETHPLLPRLEEEALARWALYLGAQARPAFLEKLRAARFPELLARCHPSACPERLRVALDFLIWNFAWDDAVDEGEVCADWVRAQNWRALAVLQGAVPGADAPPLLELLGDLRARMAECMPRAWLWRFVEACRAYFHGTWREAQARGEQRHLDVASYIALRRLSVGTSMVFTQVEAVEGFVLPDEVLAHPALARLMTTATDAIAWANDLFSFPQDTRDAFHPNLVSSLREERGLTLRDALDLAVRMHDTSVRCFLVRETSLPSFGEHDAAVSRLVLGLRRWMRANIDWSLASGRYPHAPAGAGHSRVA